jgi:hypothetical protein
MGKRSIRWKDMAEVSYRKKTSKRRVEEFLENPEVAYNASISQMQGYTCRFSAIAAIVIIALG